MYCNVICTGLPLRLFSTLVFFWKRHVIPCDSRIDMYCLLNVSVLDVLVDLSRIFSVTYRPI